MTTHSKLEKIEAAYWENREKVEGRFVSDGSRVTHSGPATGGGRIDAVRIQTAAIRKAFDILGDDIWNYGYKSGRKMKNFQFVLQEARAACKYEVNERTFRRWLIHYLQFGEVEPLTTKKKLRGKHLSSFTKEDDEALITIINDSPQLYLDEISDRLSHDTGGKVWSPSTIWKRMKTLGYSLQKAVFRARQASAHEQEAFWIRLQDNVSSAGQLLIIDETHKSKNASRRQRAWGLKGQTPILPTYFEEDFKKRCTMIGAANINGFVKEACEIVERVEGTDHRGTVDTSRFENYLENVVKPVLGNYENGEPNSVVLMDNATIHLSERTEEIINDAGAILLLTAPYSPHLNPIEYFFSTYKASLKKCSYERSEGTTWFDVHWKSLQSVTPEASRKTFQLCNFPLSAEEKSMIAGDESLLDYFLSMII